jgi:dTDP-4-amino-4,6-dideoxygalactose transaminase
MALEQAKPVTTNAADLAIHGGPRVRDRKMPMRKAFGESEIAKVMEVIEYFRTNDVEIGYEGAFEDEYTRAFAESMGGGYADAVATGTASVYVALQALQLPAGCEVLITPITDAGPVNSIIIQNMVPVIADARPGSYNSGAEEIFARVTDKTRGIILVHAIGEPTDVDEIVREAHARGIKVLEDCSQSHAAQWKGRPVGTYGDIAAFSTMFKKTHISGSSGGVVFTRDEDLYRLALACADRGKPRWSTEFDDRSPRTNLFPALNWNSNEISCAIATSSLARLPQTREGRLQYVRRVSQEIEARSSVCRPYGYTEDFSPFIYPIFVDETALRCDKKTFAEAVRAEGIDLNPHYGFIVTEWTWIQPYLSDDFRTPQVIDARDRSFCLYLNENYGEDEVADTVEAILKVERHYRR